MSKLLKGINLKDLEEIYPGIIQVLLQQGDIKLTDILNNLIKINNENSI